MKKWRRSDFVFIRIYFRHSLLFPYKSNTYFILFSDLFIRAQFNSLCNDVAKYDFIFSAMLFYDFTTTTIESNWALDNKIDSTFDRMEITVSKQLSLEIVEFVRNKHVSIWKIKSYIDDCIHFKDPFSGKITPIFIRFPKKYFFLDWQKSITFSALNNYKWRHFFEKNKFTWLKSLAILIQ